MKRVLRSASEVKRGGVQLLAVGADTAGSGTRLMRCEAGAGGFSMWKAALANSGWPESGHAEERREILALLRLGQVGEVPATIIVVKEYLAERARQGPNSVRVRRWWFF